MHRYKAVGFDYGGVIQGVPGSVFMENMGRLLGVTHDQLHLAYFAHNKPFNRGEIDRPELWARVCRDLGKTELAARAAVLGEDPLYKVINPKVLELVDRLRQAGFKTGLLSNNTLEGGRRMRADEGLAAHFDVFHISAETGDVKPEPAAFIKFASDLGVRPDELIFIDDSEISLSTAPEVGFKPVLFTDYDSLIMSLQELSVIASSAE